MTVNHISLTLRNLCRNRIYGLLSIFGLATGIGSVIVISIYIQDELTFDTSLYNGPEAGL